VYLVQKPLATIRHQCAFSSDLREEKGGDVPSARKEDRIPSHKRHGEGAGQTVPSSERHKPSLVGESFAADTLSFEGTTEEYIRDTSDREVD
jgi:hypothetical protein